jgi:hypothetical protein
LSALLTLVKSEDVNRNESVLVDGQSLLAVRGWDRFYARYPASYRELENKALCNLVHNIIIYEHILVDSQLLAVNEDCRRVCEYFPSVFRALRIPVEFRNGIARELFGTVNSHPSCKPDAVSQAA